MARYEYECRVHGPFEQWYQMGHAPETVDCPTILESGGWCQERAKRLYSFLFTEDKRRFRRGLSPVTGQPYASSRSEEKVIEKQSGIEFIAPSDMPSSWKAARDYHRHVKSGGDRVDPKSVMPPEKIPGKSILQRMAEKGVRVPS